jgi:type I restriction-modification system DNA methylase subunit
MGNAGRNGGEYYTPRPLIKSIVKVVSPKIGNSIYDGAVGSAGFTGSFACFYGEILLHFGSFLATKGGDLPK